MHKGYLVGEKFQSFCGEFEIIERLPKRRFRVRFSDGYEKEVGRGGIISRKIKNPYAKTVNGVGYLGEGKYNTKEDPNHKLTHSVWRGMMVRCYNPKSSPRSSSYVDCSVCEEWHNYQVFAEWYSTQEGFGKGYQLDKDLTKLDNKIYCPEFCYLIPSQVNSLFAGYKSKGIYWDERDELFIVRCRVGFKCDKNLEIKRYVGCYKTEEEAILAYNKAKMERVLDVVNQYKDCLTPKIIENLIILAEGN